jgi:hypothetical protein
MALSKVGPLSAACLLESDQKRVYISSRKDINLIEKLESTYPSATAMQNSERQQALKRNQP